MFDTLGYARYLEASGVPRAPAEAHAEAARRFLLSARASEGDMPATVADLQSGIERLSRSVTIRFGVMWVIGIIWFALTV